MYPHRIRLRGPWECEPIGTDTNGPQPRRVFMPCQWGGAGLTDFHGLARFTRKFGYPGKADPEFEHIWLTCDGSTGCREIHLNGQLLANNPGESFAFDVTPLMGPRNQLEVLIDGAADNAGLWGEVALEIRKDAYLAKVTAERTAEGIVISGNVVGVAPQPLELYTLVDHRHIDYRTIVPTPAGTSFRINLALKGELVRVELIHISVIWYIVELPIR